jgi:hypothetical protein
MASIREQVVRALFELLRDGLTAGGRRSDVQRNRDRAQKVAAHGDVIVRDGLPGDPEISMSPRKYFYSHEIPIEVAFDAADKEGGLDALLSRIGGLIKDDPTLGGLCICIEPTAPNVDVIDTNGATGARWADFSVIANYVTDWPL